jgi:two-component system phosphate regulon response regulator PhoB
MASERILVIDDDEQVASYVRLSFMLNGYQVEWVQDGKKGVQKAREILPDAIILDLKMPGISGYRICEDLRADTHTRAIPIIIVSGSWKNAEDRIRSIEAGADEFLPKPFRPQTIKEKIVQLLSKSGFLADATK